MTVYVVLIELFVKSLSVSLLNFIDMISKQDIWNTQYTMYKSWCVCGTLSFEHGNIQIQKIWPLNMVLTFTYWLYKFDLELSDLQASTLM